MSRLVLAVPISPFNINYNINATIREYDVNEDNKEENQIIFSKIDPQWMITVGRDTYKRQATVHCSVDDMDNLDVIGSSMPISLERLEQKMKEKFELGQILIEASANTRPDGTLMITSLWVENPEADSNIYIFDANETNPERFLSPVSLPVSLTGFYHNGKDQYILVTVQPKRRVEMQVTKTKLIFDVEINECLKQDKELASQFYVAQKFNIYMSNDTLKCSAIYWYQHGASHRITYTNNTLLSEHEQLRSNFTRYTSLTPKQVSVANNTMLILWSNVPIWPFPRAIPLLTYDVPIPFQYINGMNMELPTDLLSYLNNRVVSFMQKLEIPGLSIALAKNELLKLAVAFGYSDVVKKVTMTPDDKIRVGSVSKTITSTAIFLLIENGDITLDERVFGFGGILGMDMTDNLTYPRYVDEITVRHLLGHTVGAYGNTPDDPIFKTEQKTATDMIKEVIATNPLKKPPGNDYLYSNFGYAILGKVIEYRSGMSYSEFVNRKIFLPIGLGRQMTMSGGFRSPPDLNVLYYSTPDSPDDPYDLPDQSILEACCGWVLSPQDTVKFLTHIDGLPLKRDLIRPESVYKMGTPTRESNYTYGLGWAVNEKGFNGRAHQGQMPSSLNYLLRTDSGIELAISMNRYPQRYVGEMELSYLVHHIVSLFEGPDLNGIDHFMDNQIVMV